MIKLKNKNLKIILLSFCMPVLLIPMLPILLLFSDIILPVKSLIFYGAMQIIVPMFFAITINSNCKEHFLKKRLCFGYYSICMALSVCVGTLWAYLFLRNAAHPMLFPEYLLVSGVYILFHLAFYALIAFICFIIEKIKRHDYEE